MEKTTKNENAVKEDNTGLSQLSKLNNIIQEATKSNAETLARLREGDNLDDDDNQENQDNGAAPAPDAGDAGGDMGGDVGGDAGGGDVGGDGASGANAPSEQDTEDAIDEMQSNTESYENIPKDLVLNDGTSTGTAVDSNNQTTPLNDDEKNFEFQFGEGNFNEFTQSAEAYSQSVISVIHTFVPLCEKAMIELLGTSNSYKRVSFDAKTNMDNGNTSIDVNLKYKANTWIGSEIPYQALQQDQQHIANTISVVPGITIKQVSIDNNTGNLNISVNIGVPSVAPEENQQMQQQVVSESMTNNFERWTESIENFNKERLERYDLSESLIRKVVANFVESSQIEYFMPGIKKIYLKSCSKPEILGNLKMKFEKAEVRDANVLAESVTDMLTCDIQKIKESL